MIVSMFRRLHDWLTLRDYDRARETALRGVVARYARGNIAMQEGRFLTKADMAELRREGDAAAERLRRKIRTERS